MPQNHTHHRLTDTGAGAIKETFVSYRAQFDAVTTRAQSRFQGRDWRGMRADAAARLDIYKIEVDNIESTIRHLLGDHIEDKQVWADLKSTYAALVRLMSGRYIDKVTVPSVDTFGHGLAQNDRVPLPPVVEGGDALDAPRGNAR